MRKFNIFILLLIMVGSVNAQFLQNQQSVRIAHDAKVMPALNGVNNTRATVPYLETFDAGMPIDFQLFDVDGNVVYTPYQSFITDAWAVVSLTGFTTPAATSTSWYNTAATSNDWMITTGVDIPASGTYEIKWKGKASDTSPYNDSYEVYVTNTIAGATPVVADFVGSPIFTTPGENNSWTNHSYVLPGTFNGSTIYIAFRNNMTDGNLLSIDDIEVKSYVAYVNEIEVLSTNAEFGMNYYEVTPLSQAGTVDLYAVVINNGSAAQTNVTLHVDDAVNSISGTDVIASLASGVQDTLVYSCTIDNTTAKQYGFKMNVTQTETDEVPANNLGDSVYFDTDVSWYLRSSALNMYLSTYSFAAPIVATTGMEYGCNYHFFNDDVIDSIFVGIYEAYGSGTVTAILYSQDLVTGARTVVAQSAPYTPTGAIEFAVLGLTTPYTVTAPAILTATVQLNLNVAANDTIKILADGNFIGDASIAGAAYLNNAGTWGWYTTGTAPIVGLIVDNATGISSYNSLKDIFVYPNPANDVVYVSEIANITIVNMLGQVVASVINANQINVSEIPSGTYIIQVQTENNISTQKINISK
ncbi:MAG: T9SS type A sorting domain-containing protein [Bacteroidota bacterium]